ncbi:MAG: excinuclease ABC subunit UvrC, partial [Phycisphaerae bacterium]
SPGVYFMKDAQGRVLYIGKAKDLRSRVGSYFQPSADLLNTRGPEIARMVAMVTDVDFLDCETEVDALLRESRLIKDIQPQFNAMLKDDKTFPYIEITTRDDFPAVYVTRTPRLKGSKLYGPFSNPAAIRDAVNALQKVFKYRTCELDIADGDQSRRYFRPCLLHAIDQCSAPCADLISREDYRKDINRLKKFMASKRSTVVRQMTGEMKAAAQARNYADAARIRNRIKAIESLALSGDVHQDVQPEVFYIDPTQGLEKLAELLGMENPPRSIEGIDIANLGGSETVGSLVCFIDGKPFKNGYRRFRIRWTESPIGSAGWPTSFGGGGGDDRGGVASPGPSEHVSSSPPCPKDMGHPSKDMAHPSESPLSDQPIGPDDYASIREVVTRRYRYAAEGEELYPDVILIDGGLGQLHAARDAFSEMNIQPPMVISLAKRMEEIYTQARAAPVRLARNNPALRLLQQVRDEAHRFAQHYHHILRRKKTFDEDVK